MGADLMQFLFKTAAMTVSLYTTLCFVRIIITWFPRAQYSSFGRFLSSLCDPYLNLFGRLPFRFGAFDFTPMLAIGTLSVGSAVLSNISNTGRIYFAGIIANLLSMLWSILSSIAGLFLALLILRLIVLAFIEQGRRPDYGSVWHGIDATLNPLVMKIASRFTGGKVISYQSALLITIAALVTFIIGGWFVQVVLIKLIITIPI